MTLRTYHEYVERGQNKEGGMHIHIVKYTAKISIGKNNQILVYRRCLSYSEDTYQCRIKIPSGLKDDYTYTYVWMPGVQAWR